MLKYKLVSSEKSQRLRDESRRLIGGLSKKEIDICDSDVSKVNLSHICEEMI